MNTISAEEYDSLKNHTHRCRDYQELEHYMGIIPENYTHDEEEKEEKIRYEYKGEQII